MRLSCRNLKLGASFKRREERSAPMLMNAVHTSKSTAGRKLILLSWRVIAVALNTLLHVHADSKDVQLGSRQQFASLNNFAEVSQLSVLTAKHLAHTHNCHITASHVFFLFCFFFAIVPSARSAGARRNEATTLTEPLPHSLTRINISCDVRTRQRIKSATYILRCDLPINQVTQLACQQLSADPTENQGVGNESSLLRAPMCCVEYECEIWGSLSIFKLGGSLGF